MASSCRPTKYMVAAPDGSDIRRIGMDQRYAGKLTPFYADSAMVLLFGSHYILRYDLAADTIGPVLEQPAPLSVHMCRL